MLFIKKKYSFLNKFFIFSIIFLFTLQLNFDVDASHTTTSNHQSPEIFDVNYEIEKFVDGFRYPSTITFVDNELLILEKNSGKIFHVHDNGVKEVIPVLDLDIDSSTEGGLLGSAAIKNHVYLFFSQSQSGQDRNFQDITTKDVLYQFTWEENKLSNPLLIKSFDGSHYHKSGVLTTDGENYIYLIRGDGDDSTSHYPLMDPNYEKGIFRISDSDLSVEVFGTGIRNSFGISIDPITGYLWETENGDHTYDEINLIKKGFHGGWDKVIGPSDRFDSEIQNNFNDLPNFIDENYTYYEPKFSWYHTIGPTFIAFPDDVSFSEYKEWLFTGESNGSNIYKFHLNPSRDELIFNDQKLAKDFVLDQTDNNEEIIFAKIPGKLITDAEFHHTGMYLVSYLDGAIYRIFPKEPLDLNSQYIALEKNIEDLICKRGFMVNPINKTNLECIPLKSGLSILSENDEKNMMIKINARNQNLQDIELKNLNLSYSDFTNATFGNIISSINFTKTNLSHVDLSNKDLTNTILTGADLTGANMRNVDLSNKDLTNTILTGADLTGANMRNVEVTQEIENVNMYDDRIKNTFWDWLESFIQRNFNNFLNRILN
jgi:aldose sugar dehydrogenase